MEMQPYHPKTIMAAIIDLGPGGWSLWECNWDWALDLILGIQLGTAFAVGDGSYMPDRSKELATLAWIMQKEVESCKQCWGECMTSGTINEVNSYHAELHGVHGMLLALMVLCRVFQLKSGITLACDNNNAVYHTNKGSLDVASLVKHTDLMRAIHHLWKELTITVHMVEVNGHQNKTTAFANLSPLKKLNCLADYDAKSLLWKTIKEQHPMDPSPVVPNHIHSEGIQRNIDGEPGNPRNAIPNHMFHQAIAKELDRKGTLPYTAFGYVNWNAMDSTLAHRSPSFCTWVTKHVTGECGVGRKMLRWKLWDMDACPCCKTGADEMTTHYPFCEATDMMAVYNKAVEEFLLWMKEADTDPCIAAFFYSALKECSFPSTQDNWTPDKMLPAINEQTAIYCLGACLPNG
jgi:hypothetical protein